MQIGYMRVSTKKQETQLQEDALIKAGVLKENIYSDMLSGAKKDRPGQKACLERLQEGDQLVVWKLDRFGRGATHTLGLLDELTKRGVGFVSLTEGFDLSTPMGRAMLGFMAVIAQMEREILIERIEAGHEVARDRGVKFGQKMKIDRSRVLALRGAPVRRIAEIVGASKSQVAMILREAA